jgi:hypothetical protein
MLASISATVTAAYGNQLIHTFFLVNFLFFFNRPEGVYRQRMGVISWQT